jgi:hypothetical protein
MLYCLASLIKSSANPRGGSSASSHIRGGRLSDALVAFGALAAARVACRAVRLQAISRNLSGRMFPPVRSVRGRVHKLDKTVLPIVRPLSKMAWTRLRLAALIDPQPKFRSDLHCRVLDDKFATSPIL